MAGATGVATRVPSPPLPPGSWLALLGGGQLGRMFCMAAQSMGYRVCVLDPGTDSPAGTVADRHLRADYLDPSALDELARTCAAATTEFENVPARALRFLGERMVVAPGAEAVAIAQDRLAEKAFVRDCGIDVAPYAAIRGTADLDALAASEAGADAEVGADGLFPGILKVAQLGYDGKGQARVADLAEARAAFAAFGGVPCVLERRLSLESEVSVVVARAFDGRVTAWPVAENVHRDGILATSTVPAGVPDATARAAVDATVAIASRLGYVGVLCVEFFVLADGRLLVNEMAPRPHNSGHWTIDAAVTSQFEQQVRALAGLPLGDTAMHAPAVMLNLLGDCWFGAGAARGDTPHEPDWRAVLSEPTAKLHLYGKAQARPGRKMGHVTVVGAGGADAPAIARRIAAALGAAC